jgi:RND family efflux transporter MFP subunit
LECLLALAFSLRKGLIKMGRSHLSSWVGSGFLACVLFTATGCGLPGREAAEAQPARSPAADPSEAIAVETITVQPGRLDEALDYTGTTQPFQEVSLRSQVEGQLLSLSVDVGDPVATGQILGQVDAAVLQALVNAARAELAARQSEVAQAEAAVSDARAQVERARAEMLQAQADANRLQGLVADGAVTAQQAEQAQTAFLATEQVLRSAEEQVRTRQQAVIAAQGRVAAQAALVAQAEERRSQATMVSPLNGVVLDKVLEPGNLVQPGTEVLKLGDFSAIKVVVQVSELDLAQLQRGQAAQVSLDAFPGESWSGSITRISPVADATARLVPIEVTIPNRDRRIGSGLLARVSFTSGDSVLILPEQALAITPDLPEPTVFVLDESQDAPTVHARPVETGDRANGQVEILAGLSPGERVVIRSDRPLEDSQAVRLSILSQ